MQYFVCSGTDFPGSAEADFEWGGNLDCHLMASYVKKHY